MKFYIAINKATTGRRHGGFIPGEPAVGTVFRRGRRPVPYQRLQLFVGVLGEVFTHETVSVDDQRQEVTAPMSLRHFTELRQLAVVTATASSSSSSSSFMYDFNLRVTMQYKSTPPIE